MQKSCMVSGMRCSKNYPAPIAHLLTRTGGPAKLSRLLGISSTAVTQWKEVPARHLPRIEAHTGISGRELRPDLYGNADGTVITQQVAA